MYTSSAEIGSYDVSEYHIHLFINVYNIIERDKRYDHLYITWISTWFWFIEIILCNHYINWKIN